MIVLGISYCEHDAGAAIIRDTGGALEIVAISEARLVRHKHAMSFPLLSMRYCLDALGLSSLSDVDYLGFEQTDARWPGLQPSQYRKQSMPTFTDNGLDENFNYLCEQSLIHDRSKVRFVHHIDAHAASAFYASGFEDAAVMTMEGGLGIYRASGIDLRPIDRLGYNGALFHNGHQIASPFLNEQMVLTPTLYSNTTNLMFGSNFDSGKTMALAAYGDRFPKRNQLNASPARFFDFIILHNETVRRLWEIPRPVPANSPVEARDALLTEPWINLAREVQEIFEEDALHLARLAKEKTGAERLCMAGGSALSCVTNRKIRDSGLFSDLFVQPAASDEGLALGTALATYYRCGGRTKWRMKTAYLGAGAKKPPLETWLRELGVPFRPAEPAVVASLIAEGKIVGRSVGASEYGPRALGNRSILADPRRADMPAILNRRVKHRESFRPFAPSCHLDKATRYFDLPFEAPFMIVAAQVKSEARDTIPGVVHVDGSTRPQTVTREQNPGYYDLIEAFGELTGVYVLLNTSFNDNGEPIVETYEDALISFAHTGLDHLVLDHVLINRLEQGVELAARLATQRQAALARRYEDGVGAFCDMSRWQVLVDGLKQGRFVAEDGMPGPNFIV